MSKRSIKVHGTTTSIFLEDAFWREIERRAEENHLSESQYLRTHILSEDGADVSANRSAYIKASLLSQLREDYERLASKQRQSTWLIELHDTRRREIFRGDVISVGSDRHNRLVINDPSVDPKHALLVNDGHKWWAFDLQSTSGMHFNNKKVGSTGMPRRGELKLGAAYLSRI